MNGSWARGCSGLVLGVLAVLTACNGPDGGAECNCPADEAVATIELCGAIESTAADPDGDCDVQQASGKLYVQSGVAGTCHVEVTFATGATASTDIVITSGGWMACGSDPHGCGQSLVAAPTTLMLGPCAAADAGGD